MIPHTETEIVFIHRGKSWYLPYAVYQAKRSCPASGITLLSDCINLTGINNVHFKNITNPDLLNFEKNFVYMSSNPRDFELFCWLRWFYLREYMHKNHLQSVLYLDSDVLIYSSIEDIMATFLPEKSYCALSISQQRYDSLRWSASGHVSYWTPASINDFCEFSLSSFTDDNMLDLYKDKWRMHLTESKPGGICDMTTLYLFWHKYKERIHNLLTVNNGTVFDDNINESANYRDDEFETVAGRKKLVFHRGYPHFTLNDGVRGPIRAHALHFQGEAKDAIPAFYTGNNFRGRRYNEALSLLVSAAGKAVEKIITKLKSTVNGSTT